ncbi:MAG: cobalamin biosynthesis protein CobD [Desulfobacterales bacterium]|jgi:adenosylcobinamide-phosphate synthase|nr:cobalamin biosynthesis protein CobD [Desulfobacterales bacterium]
MMENISTWYIIPAAFILDYIVGDPHRLPHPIRLMGKAIIDLEPYFRRIPLPVAASGFLFSLCLISLAWVISYLLIWTGDLIHPVIGYCMEIILIYYCISMNSLDRAAMGVCRPLEQEDLKTAKEKVTLIVGRDVNNLDEEGVARATVETIAENLVDGIISPLFFAAIGGAPLAVTYKMVNTLDSMVGYKNDKYILFGKASARIDDLVNLIPARLSVFVIAAASQFLSGRGVLSLRTVFKEGKNHSSPNAGYPEAGFAGALNVRLGGPNYYFGSLVSKPFIGNGFGRVKIGDIRKACDLMLLSSFLWFIMVWGVNLLYKILL